MNDIELIKNLVDYGIFGILLLMSFLSLFFYIERLLFYKNLKIKNYKHKEKLEIDITNNITIISSIAANAVYIGLLGTVLGIIITFYTISEIGQVETKTIMSALAIALKATAFGLLVAIPAMMFYNHLVRKIEVLLSLWHITDED